MNEPRTLLKLPQMGNIRKGAAKNPQGYVGKDLQSKFRFEFFPGFEDAKAEFIRVMGGLIIDRFVCVLPFTRLGDNWQDFYEAYTKGRMIARATESRFIRLVDLQTGQVAVQDGEPETGHTPGQLLGTVGKTAVRTRRTGRLTLVIPQLGRLATFTLHTTSIYDCVNIGGQLASIQSIAAAARLPLAGIPLSISRRITEVTWVKEGGESARVKTGLINIEADPEWVRPMLQDMARRALPNGGRPLELVSGPVVVHPADRIQAEQDGQNEGEDDPSYDGGEEVQEGAFTEQSAAQEKAPVEAQKPTAPMAATPQAAEKTEPTINNGIERPYIPEVLKKKLESRHEYNGRAATEPQRNLLRMILNETLAGPGAVEAEVNRMRQTVQTYLTGHAHSKDIPDGFILVMLNLWLKPKKDSGGAYSPDPMAAREAKLVYEQAIKDEGQMILTGLDPATEAAIPEEFR